MSSPIVFDIYSSSKLLGKLGRAPVLFAWLSGPMMLLAAAITCLAEGTLGRLRDVSAIDDFWALVGRAPMEVTMSSFPLARDISTILLTLSIGLAVVCLHSQWGVYSASFADLERNGVLRWRVTLQPLSLLQRWLAPLAALPPGSVNCRNEFLALLGRVEARNGHRDVIALSLSLLVTVAVLGYERYFNIFTPFTPERLPSDVRERLANQLYQDWWASVQHPLSTLVYGGILFVGLYTVLCHNAITIMAVRLLTGLHACAELKINWTNIDGSFGWLPIRDICRLAYFSVAIRAAQMTILILFLGWRSLIFVGVLLAVWLAFLAVYLIYPFQIIQKIVERERAQQLMLLATTFERSGQSLDHPTVESDVFIREIERVRTAVVHPMQLGKVQSSGFSIVILLPVVLTLIQVLAG